MNYHNWTWITTKPNEQIPQYQRRKGRKNISTIADNITWLGNVEAQFSSGSTTIISPRSTLSLEVSENVVWNAHLFCSLKNKTVTIIFVMNTMKNKIYTSLLADGNSQ